jgi:hypothetical protein
VTVLAGQHDGRCLGCHPSRPQMAVVQAELAHLVADLGLIPRQIQTDRDACFLGAEEPGCAALPGRLTLWLAGLDIGHRFSPVRRPQHNGAVERFHGALARSWQGEPEGIAALMAVWNLDRPPLSRRHRRYRGCAGFSLARVWRLLVQTQVARRVTRQGTLSRWDHNVSVGRQAAGQTVTVHFDPTTRQAVITDAHEQVLWTAALPWLTADWLWAPIPPTDHRAHPPDRSTCR